LNSGYLSKPNPTGQEGLGSLASLWSLGHLAKSENLRDLGSKSTRLSIYEVVVIDDLVGKYFRLSDAVKTAWTFWTS
jgi:hypothetical protein